jgi:hypothetical protein
MATVSLNAASQTAPGVYVFENAVGPTPAALASFNRVYYLGSASAGPATTPTQIISAVDFTNQFTSSSAINLNNIDFFFRNVPSGQLWYSRVQPAPVATVELANTDDGTFTATINTEDSSFVASGNSAQEIIEGLVAAINDNTAINTAVQAEFEIDDAGANVFSNSLFYLRSLDPSVTFTATGTANLTISAVAAPATPNYWDYIYVINNAYTDVMEQGFIVCPEAFYSLTRQYERTQVATTMENVAATELFDWMAFVDPGPPGTIDTKAEFKTEGELITTSRGHVAYYCPWIKDTDNDWVSPALGAATVALRRYAAEGFNQPPAGPAYPLRGVSAVQTVISQSEHADLNANQINVVRFLRGIGYTVYGGRTRSVDPFYRFINTRIILNIYARTLRETLMTGKFLFSVIDGQGVLFNRIKETADLVAYRFWSGSAFFGNNPQDAFLNVCDRTNNPAVDLENGIVRLDSYVAPSPTAERIFVGVFRVAIDQVSNQQEV